MIILFYGAKNLTIQIDDTTADYITFGRGEKPLVIIPGLGDGLKTVKGTAVSFAFMYKIFAKDFKVYVFSRRNNLKSGFSIENMAEDTAYIMEKLNIENACVLGVSQGGMIAMCLAEKFPNSVQRLVLAVTAARPNEISKKVLSDWIASANKNDFDSIFIDTAEKSYTEKRLKVYRSFYPLLCKISRPKSLDKFIIQAAACLNYNAYEKLKNITCPTLVIGGEEDKIVGGAASAEIAGQIKGSQLKMYKDLGHGLYEQAKDFNSTVLGFFTLQN